jgi:hypothetical protein
MNRGGGTKNALAMKAAKASFRSYQYLGLIQRRYVLNHLTRIMRGIRVRIATKYTDFLLLEFLCSLTRTFINTKWIDHFRFYT